MTQASPSNPLLDLSLALAGVVERAGPSVARVDDGSRLTASGTVWTEDGLVLTTSHGVEREEGLHVELADGARLPAVLAGRDPDTDLAVLRVEASGLPAVESAPEEEVRVGHLVLALARPGAAGLQATHGIISARFDTERDGRAGYILHTDALLYPGWSGGLLVDVLGRAVGITNLMFGRGKGVAIGMPVAAQVAEALLRHGRVRRAFLGVTSQAVPLPAGLREKLGLAQERAVLLLQVEPGSPADAGGLLIGDLLLKVGPEGVSEPDELRRVLRSYASGDQVTLALLRGGELRELEVSLGG